MARGRKFVKNADKRCRGWMSREGRRRVVEVAVTLSWWWSTRKCRVVWWERKKVAGIGKREKARRMPKKCEREKVRGQAKPTGGDCGILGLWDYSGSFAGRAGWFYARRD